MARCDEVDDMMFTIELEGEPGVDAVRSVVSARDAVREFEKLTVKLEFDWRTPEMEGIILCADGLSEDVCLSLGPVVCALCRVSPSVDRQTGYQLHK
jgi:hypothetical protein